jgi:Fe2+ transport system protein FeoA
MALSHVPAGGAVRISRICGDFSEHAKLLALGLVPGVSLEVVAAHAGGALVVEAGGRRLVLDRGSAELIEVDDGDGDGGATVAQPCG